MQYEYHGRVRIPKYVAGRTKYQGSNARRLAQIVDQALPVFRTLLEFDDDLLVTLKPMGRVNTGMYDPNVCMVESEYRNRDDFTVMSIIAHELVHAEQYHQGRLDSEWVGDGYMYKWNNTYYCVLERDYNKYIPPWELEAYDRQDGLALAVCAELGV